jgi:phosphocarrier protein HPr
MKLLRGEVRILDPLGLHSRPAGEIVKLARTLDFEIKISVRDGEFVSALSPLGLMALKAKPGETLVVEAETSDQQKLNSVLGRIQDLLNG